VMLQLWLYSQDGGCGEVMETCMGDGATVVIQPGWILQ
jgi:hypothetical protein